MYERDVKIPPLEKRNSEGCERSGIKCLLNRIQTEQERERTTNKGFVSMSAIHITFSRKTIA